MTDARSTMIQYIPIHGRRNYWRTEARASSKLCRV